jgi:hypothetical protein
MRPVDQSVYLSQHCREWLGAGPERVRVRDLDPGGELSGVCVGHPLVRSCRPRPGDLVGLQVEGVVSRRRRRLDLFLCRGVPDRLVCH